jgi:Zn-dependent M28 family amino/carboxypeptidase
MKLLPLLALVLAAPEDLPPAAGPALQGVDPERIRAHIEFLASDLLEGRGTGARGSAIAEAYVAAAFGAAGLEPGAPGGSWFQKVPLVTAVTKPDSALSITAGGAELALARNEDYVLESASESFAVEAGGELVFCGYGIQAPEHSWDDFQGLAPKGKVLLVLVNDPPSDDPAWFGGKALTYYGRWTYKYELGEKLAAAGVLIVHDTEGAGYGWDVVRNSWGSERSALPRRPGPPHALPFQGWLTEPAAKRLLEKCGQDLGALRAAAAKREFRPVALGATVRARVSQEVRRGDGRNVIARLRGSDPKLRDEAVLFTAHHDHLGIGIAEDGDGIYNGAVDNASGVATLLELARAAAAAGTPPARSFLFATVCAEEQGLLGSLYMAQSPPIPAAKLLANVNMDGTAVLGETEDFTFLGAERSKLGAHVERAAKALGFQASPDPHPEKGFYFRSDQFSFAKVGIPALKLGNGLRYRGRPAAWGEERFQDYVKHRYHRPKDEPRADWNLAGSAQLARVALYLGYSVSERGDPR